MNVLWNETAFPLRAMDSCYYYFYFLLSLGYYYYMCKWDRFRPSPVVQNLTRLMQQHSTTSAFIYLAVVSVYYKSHHSTSN